MKHCDVMAVKRHVCMRSVIDRAQIDHSVVSDHWCYLRCDYFLYKALYFCSATLVSTCFYRDTTGSITPISRAVQVELPTNVAIQARARNYHFHFNLYLDFFQCAGQALAKPSLG